MQFFSGANTDGLTDAIIGLIYVNENKLTTTNDGLTHGLKLDNAKLRTYLIIKDLYLMIFFMKFYGL